MDELASFLAAFLTPSAARQTLCGATNERILSIAEIVANANTAAASFAFRAAIGTVDVGARRKARIASFRRPFALVFAAGLIWTTAKKAGVGVTLNRAFRFAMISGHANAG